MCAKWCWSHFSMLNHSKAGQCIHHVGCVLMTLTTYIFLHKHFTQIFSDWFFLLFFEYTYTLVAQFACTKQTKSAVRKEFWDFFNTCKTRGYIWIWDAHAYVVGCTATGIFGPNCTIPCPEVNCQYCHIETGTCQGCKPGFKGYRCEQGNHLIS